MELAVLGMGTMGQAVARRLLGQGQQVTVWNRTPGRADDVVAEGAREATSPRQAATGADAVLVSLASDDAVRAVVLGEGGAASLGGGLPGDAVLVDTSTVSPTTSRRIASAAAGGRAISAPILGAPRAVLDGEAGYLLGGPHQLVERLEPLWSSLSPTHHWVGEDQGAATTLKLLANYLLLSGLATLAEAVAAGQRLGMEDDTLRGFFSVLPMVAPGLHNRLDDVVSGDHHGWFSAVLGAKDARLFNDLVGSAGLHLPLASLVQERYEELAARGLGDADIAAVVELLR